MHDDAGGLEHKRFAPGLIVRVDGGVHLPRGNGYLALRPIQSKGNDDEERHEGSEVERSARG